MSFSMQDGQLPATLKPGPVTDDDFAALCAEHPDLGFEMTAEGKMIITAPAFSFTAARNARIAMQLGIWADKDGRGITFNSSAGFVLPNGARRSPNSCWLLSSRITPQDGKSFLHLCPDFVIELRSDTDRLPPLQRKLEEYIGNGARLGWLLDPETESVEIYRPDGGIERIANATRVEGEGPVAGFVLELARVWNPLGQ